MKKTLCIPDLHGETRFLNWVLREFPKEKFHYIFLGDLIDRGPNSAQVVQKVRELVEGKFADLCMGNHEDMFIRGFLGGHQDYLRLWMGSGGMETVQSYEKLAKGDRDKVAEMLTLDALWLKENAAEWLVTKHNILCVHASRPYVNDNWEPWPNLTEKQEQAHLWDRPSMYMPKLPEGILYSIHGHTPQKKPQIYPSTSKTIYIDLGGVFDRIGHCPSPDKFCVWNIEDEVCHTYLGNTFREQK